MPLHDLILKRYLLKFGKGGKLPASEAEHYGFVNASDDPAFDDVTAPAPTPAPAPAPASAPALA